MKKKIGYVISFLLIMVILRIFLFEIFVVNQSSMRNTYQPGDRALVLKSFYTIKPNSVFIFKRENDYMIKRCVGLSGDTIEIIDNVVYLNNLILKNTEKTIIAKKDDNYDFITRPEIFFTYNNKWTLNNFGPYVIPKRGMRIALSPKNISIYGRIINKDSLFLTSSTKPDKGFYIFQNDYVFFIGDNRQQSTDSRVFGPILSSDVRGEVVLKF